MEDKVPEVTQKLKEEFGKKGNVPKTRYTSPHPE